MGLRSWVEVHFANGQSGIEVGSQPALVGGHDPQQVPDLEAGEASGQWRHDEKWAKDRMNEAPTNEELLDRYQRGDFGAFDLFYRRHELLLFNFLMTKLGNRADAEETMQETFLRLHASVVRYDPTQPALGWVFTIARNAATDLLRRRSRSKVEPGRDVDGLATTSPGADVVLTAREGLDQLLVSLTPEERLLLGKRFLSGDSYEAIAEAGGFSAATVRQRVSRLLKKVRG